MNRNPYVFHNAEVVRVVDGDTLDIRVDVGFLLTTVQRFRLMGYNAPETNGLEKMKGLEATLALSSLCPAGSRVVVTSYKGDAFGRWLADVLVLNQGATRNATLPEAYDCVESLVAAGYGVRWDGKGKRPTFNLGDPYPNPPKEE